MANYNKIILVGNLTRDPQLSYLPSQTPVVEFGLAVNHRWKAQDGQQREDVCFIDCRAYGKTAEVVNQYLHKGSQALVEGRLQFDQWTDKDGNKRSKHRIFVDNVQFLDTRQQGSQGQAPQQAPQQGSQGYAPQQAPQQGGQGQAPQQGGQGYAPQQGGQGQAPQQGGQGQAPQQAPQQARQMRPPQAPQQAPPGMDEPPAPGPQGPAGEEPQRPAYEEDFAGGQDNIPF